MSSLHVFLLALQVQTPGSVDRETLLVIFVGIIALFFLALILGMIVAVAYALKLKRDVLKAIDSVKATVQTKAYPVVASTNEFVREMTPKIKSITDDVVEISHTVRAQVTDIDSTLSDVTAKARAQADRVHGMVSSTLDTTSNMVGSVERGVKVPIREVAGILAGIKAGWDVLTRPSEPSAKSQVKRAARHVEAWEDEVAADARKAASVNDPAGARTAPGVRDVKDAVAGAGRSMVEAGDEVATTTREAAGAVAGTLEEKTQELRGRGTL